MCAIIYSGVASPAAPRGGLQPVVVNYIGKVVFHNPLFSHKPSGERPLTIFHKHSILSCV